MCLLSFKKIKHTPNDIELVFSSRGFYFVRINGVAVQDSLTKDLGEAEIFFDAYCDQKRGTPFIHTVIKKVTI